MDKVYSTRGTEIVIDFWDFDNPEYLDNPVTMEFIMRKALLTQDIVPVSVTYKKFDPHGLTMLMLLEESHFCSHLYSESSFLSLSLYTCGSANTERIIEEMEYIIKPIEVNRQTIIRGVR